MIPLPASFFARTDVLQIAHELLGKGLWVRTASGFKGGMITETEAYAANNDRASHAAGGRRTARNEVMYGEAGHAYVYRCYGIHLLLNVVTAPAGRAEAVLIRAIKPFDLEEAPRVAAGPGKLSRWLGIESTHNGSPLSGPDLLITEGIHIAQEDVIFTPRIGVAYAGSDALLPYRCYIRGELSVSRPLNPKYPSHF